MLALVRRAAQGCAGVLGYVSAAREAQEGLGSVASRPGHPEQPCAWEGEHNLEGPGAVRGG